MTPYADGRWGSLEMVHPDADADWTIVVSFLLPERLDPDGVVQVDRSKAILVQTEPNCIRHCNNTWGEYAEPEDIGFAATWTIREHHKVADWFLRATYSALYATNPRYRRDGVLSACQTWKQKYPGHKLRVKFVRDYLSGMDGFDLFGYDLPVPHTDHRASRAKDLAVFPYQYHFCAENSSEKNYFSEKVTDAFLGFCLPLYWGCPNLEEFFPPESFVRIPIDEPEHALQIVKKTIADGEWAKRLPAIREARRLVMDQYQPWPVIEKLILGLK